MAKKLGNDYLIWVKGAVTFALVKGQQTTSISRDAGSIDTTTKDDEGYGTSAPGLKSLKISTDLLPNLPDAPGYETLEANCSVVPQVAFEIQIRSGGKTGTADDAVFHGLVYGNISETSFGQNEAVKAKCEMSAAAAPIIDRLGPAAA